MTARLLAFTLASTVLSATPSFSQSSDTLLRLNTLEQQVRELNGRIEELNFLILQMQEDQRRQREDNEFRFQELEGGAPASGEEQRGDLMPSEDGMDVANDANSGPRLGTPPRVLGQVPADTSEPARDIVTGSLDLDAEFASDRGLAEAIARADTPQALYETGYDFALSGEYERAEQVFRVHRKRHPDVESAAQATYWLGESLLAQDRPEEAAEILLDGHERFPRSDWAPDMLLKVGVAMARLGNDDIACATFSEVDRLYTALPPRTMTTLERERVALGC